jgi:hypothetical protein
MWNKKQRQTVVVSTYARIGPNMKIVIATPIYPPELGGPATYTKELATRLANIHDITIVAFTNAPQPVSGVCE